MDRELKKMTAENRPEWEIEDYVVKTQGMRTMREELADLVCAGVIFDWRKFFCGRWRRGKTGERQDVRGMSCLFLTSKNAYK